MHIDQILEAIQPSTDSTVTVPDTWAQGRTVYGGLTAALVHQQMRQQVMAAQPEQPRPVRYLNFSFIGPLKVNEPIRLETTLLRSGRSATQLMTQVSQEGQICVVAQGCFGIRRDSVISITEQFQHAMKPPKRANFLPQIPGVVPRFLRHMEINMQAGRLPFMRGKLDHLHGWMRLKKAPQVFQDEHLIAVIDAWPSTVLQQLKKPAAASTMNWNLEFTQHADLPKPGGWLAYQAETSHAADGYVFGDASIWNPEGQLLALSRQTVGLFA